MLSLFPEVLFLAPFAALFMRVSVAAVFAYSASRRMQGSGLLLLFGAIDVAITLVLFVGLSTQLAGLVAALCLITWLVAPSWSPLPRSTVALALVMALSLVITGPGPFAFDLPL
jgi:uncharacterized membrane protein HdeD (DUF308 family)